MLLLRGKGPRAPFQILTQLILFGKKKPAEEPAAMATIKIEPFPIPDTIRKTVTDADIGRARNRLRVANLERDIIGDALTKIYEAEAKGTINETEKNAPPKEKPPREKARNKAEEKIETIREEVLKAMERLEQIETEG